MKLEVQMGKYKGNYVKLKNSNYYVENNDVEKTEMFLDNKRYKNYIKFDEEIITKNIVTLNYNDTKYRIYSKLIFDVIEKVDNKYYVEFDNKLVWLDKNDIEKTIEKLDKTESANEMAVLNYHFFYDPKKNEVCNQIICHTVEQFESHLKYLTDNNYFAPTLEEFEKFIDGSIRLPKKSVLVTIDDGAMGVSSKAIPLLEKYKIQAVLFLITSYWPKENYQSEYLELASHTNNMHTIRVCPGDQGGGIKCLSEEFIQNDLKTSRDILNQTVYFAYPFYEYNDYSIAMLKQAGFRMAFIGRGKKAKVGSDKMLVPRYGIDTSTGVGELKQMIE